MNNRGFTLIELLAVILILTGITLVAVAGISASLGRRETRECKEQIELAKNAAKIYFALNDANTVTISTLINNNYFNEASKISILKEKYSQYKVKIVSNSYYSICNQNESKCYDKYDKYNNVHICG